MRACSVIFLFFLSTINACTFLSSIRTSRSQSSPIFTSFDICYKVKRLSNTPGSQVSVRGLSCLPPPSPPAVGQFTTCASSSISVFHFNSFLFLDRSLYFISFYFKHIVIVFSSVRDWSTAVLFIVYIIRASIPTTIVIRHSLYLGLYISYQHHGSIRLVL